MSFENWPLDNIQLDTNYVTLQFNTFSEMSACHLAEATKIKEHIKWLTYTASLWVRNSHDILKQLSYPVYLPPYQPIGLSQWGHLPNKTIALQYNKSCYWTPPIMLQRIQKLMNGVCFLRYMCISSSKC